MMFRKRGCSDYISRGFMRQDYVLAISARIYVGFDQYAPDI